VRVEALTFLRFVAAILVVVHHYGQDTRLVQLVPGRLETAAQMVCFFFVLSGFVLMFAYFRRPNFSLDRYARARIARIAPSYVLALLITIFYVYGYRFIDYTAVALHALFLQAWFPAYALSLNPPAWSISTEVLFYLSFPLVILWLRRARPRVSLVLAAALIFWVITQWGLTRLLNAESLEGLAWPHTLVHHFPLSHLCSFLLGVAGGYLVLKLPRNYRLTGWKSIGILALVFGVVLLTLANKSSLEYVGMTLLPLESSLLSPVFFLFILVISLSDNRVTRMLSVKPLVVLGEASYAVYILQAPLHHVYELNLAARLPLSEDNHFYLFAAGLVAVSIIVYYLLERPVSRWAKRPLKLPGT
jgi:peptidoglycan/LPS O-acetylase OafA/YrhL